MFWGPSTSSPGVSLACVLRVFIIWFGLLVDILSGSFVEFHSGACFSDMCIVCSLIIRAPFQDEWQVVDITRRRKKTEFH